LHIYFYPDHGFNSTRDAVQFWHVTDASTSLVQRVELYDARRGWTFTYDETTGFLDSIAGGLTTRKAVETDDIGSPGFTTGPVPLDIRQQPQDLTVDAGTPATFSVRGTGLPVPRFQWQFNGDAIPGATSNTFSLPATTPANAGTYTVRVENGLETMISAPANLLVNTVSNPPSIVVPPADLTVTPGQKAIFTVIVRGYELPTYQWQFNGTNLVGETNQTLYVLNSSFDSSGTYSVHVQNSLGSTNGAAVLSVRPKPYLVITEMMGGHSTNTTVSGHGDWWELTNFDTNAVNLRDYRFDDFPNVPDGAVVITNDVIIQPGESVLFIQEMTVEAFTSWWGEENLPANVQCIRYSGNGIQSEFDSIYVWNATAVDRDDSICWAEYLNLNSDFTPLRGNSLNFWCDGWIEFGQTNVLGQCGAIRAVEADDIGSPGYIANHPPRTVAPRFLAISRDALGTHLNWKTQIGKRYELQAKDGLEAPSWMSLSQHTATGTSLSTADPGATGLAHRFYRLEVLPDPP
jgi:hypothetical protein